MVWGAEIMKKIRCKQFVMLLGGSILTTSCGPLTSTITGGNRRVAENRDIRDFERLVVHDNIKVSAHKGQNFQVRVSGREDAVKALKARVKDGVLTLKIDGWVENANPSVEIEAPFLSEVSGSNNADINTSGFDGGTYRAIARDNAAITSSGSTTDVHVDAAENASINVRGITASHVELNVRDNASAACAITEAASGKVEGNGYVSVQVLSPTAQIGVEVTGNATLKRE